MPWREIHPYARNVTQADWALSDVVRVSAPIKGPWLPVHE